MTILFDLDNLTVGLSYPADPELGTPPGTITAVEHVACRDHDPENGNGMGWYRRCYRCSVRWYAQHVRGNSGWAELENRYLWTAEDRAEFGEED